MKDKNHMIISIDVEKAFYKIQHEFMIKTLSKVGIMKPCITNPQPTLYSMGKNLQVFPLRLGTRQECPLSLLLFYLVL